MKLIIAIIQDKFVNNLVRNFLDENIRITKLSSTGGFLKSGNSTFLIGIDDSQLEKAKEIIKKSVKSEVIKDNNEELKVYGAHLFIVDVEKNIVL
ncbi:MAG: cyclic-di-AMP receptor [Bacillota bacterium]|nr:cyclic-di-AMP receptor [Bacillota bacterium]